MPIGTQKIAQERATLMNEQDVSIEATKEENRSRRRAMRNQY